MRPGVVAVMTGGVPVDTIEPLLSDGAVAVGGGRGGVGVACTDLARVVYITCPYAPDMDIAELTPGARPSIVDVAFMPTDGSLAENRARTRAASLVPNAIINSDRDPVDHNLDTSQSAWRRHTARLGRVAWTGACPASRCTASSRAGCSRRWPSPPSPCPC
jgi:hypothetical protein